MTMTINNTVYAVIWNVALGNNNMETARNIFAKYHESDKSLTMANIISTMRTYDKMGLSIRNNGEFTLLHLA